jgi:hypothetical protein
MFDLARVLVAVALLATGRARTETSFLEAGLFFMTGIELTGDDTVTDREIKLQHWPIVAYVTDANRCAVRIRVTESPYVINQLDFCKITYWGLTNSVGPNATWIWEGHKEALCLYKWSRADANYDGPIDDTNAQCGGLGKSGHGCITYLSGWNIYSLLHTTKRRPRSPYEVQRMVEAYKYIQSLIAIKPY